MPSDWLLFPWKLLFAYSEPPSPSSWTKTPLPSPKLTLPSPPTSSSSTEESSLASSGQEDTAGGREPAYATGRTREPDAGGREAWESGREKEQGSPVVEEQQHL